MRLHGRMPAVGLRDRAVGSVLGLALGDALGAPFEAGRRDRIPLPLPAFELPWRGMPPGTTTDATAMARNLTRSLIACEGRLDVDDVLARHLEWLATGSPHGQKPTPRAFTRARESAAPSPREHAEQRRPQA